MAQAMIQHRSLCIPPLAALLLAGCAADEGLYPSLAVRKQERVSGVFDPVTPEPWVPPAQSGEVLGNLAKYRADAADAHRRTLAAAEAARGPVAAARGAETGGDAWAAAAIALADAEARRSETMVALAEIDLLHISAQTEGSETGEIANTLSEVETMLFEEDRLIAALHAQLSE